MSLANTVLHVFLTVIYGAWQIDPRAAETHAGGVWQRMD